MDFEKINIKINNISDNKPQKSLPEIQYEPMCTNRYVLSIPNENGINEWYINQLERPNISCRSIGTQDSNGIINVITPLNYEWNDITISGFEPIGYNSFSFSNWYYEYVDYITARMGYVGVSKKDISIKKLDPTGITVEEWLLRGALITEISEDNNGLPLEIKLSMDSCLITF